MAIDAVIGGIETAFQEPGVVAVLEGARVHGLEVFLPGQQVAGEFTPEFVGVVDAFFVEGFVFVETAEVGLRGVFVEHCFGDVEGVCERISRGAKGEEKGGFTDRHCGLRPLRALWEGERRLRTCFLVVDCFGSRETRCLHAVGARRVKGSSDE